MIYNYKKLFEFFYYGVINGELRGQGNGILYVKCDDYKEVAKQFEKFLKSKSNEYVWDKEEKQDYIIFNCGYEYFVIRKYDISRKIDENNDVVIIF